MYVKRKEKKEEETGKAGMNSHVGKPLNFDEVIDQLRQYLPK